jgi:hypothetical protein
MREGIDDIRYLNTLEQALKDGSIAEAAAAEQLLKELSALLNRQTPDALGLMKLIPPAAMLNWRQKIVEALRGRVTTNSEKTDLYLPFILKSTQP